MACDLPGQQQRGDRRARQPSACRAVLRILERAARPPAAEGQEESYVSASPEKKHFGITFVKRGKKVKISELIKHLEEIRLEYGNLEIWLYIDGLDQDDYMAELTDMVAEERTTLLLQGRLEVTS